MMFKLALFLAAAQPAAAQFGLSTGDNGNGGGGNSNGGNSNGAGNSGNNGNGNGGGNIPLSSPVRSFDGIAEDPRAGNDAELLRQSGPAHYPDGMGIELSMFTEPNARLISNRVCNPDTLSAPPGKSRASDMLWQWGQFMDHDIGLTEGHDEAFTITSPDCMNGDLICTIGFQRAIHHFTNGIREQINEITGFVDASNVYGHNIERATALRDVGNGGRMRMTPDGLMPPNPLGLANANPGFDDSDFFLAGDVRANEQVGLIGIHTLWVREHNRVAGLLAARFASATDEQLYQMARKIVTGQIQHITYTEFLPILIGSFAPDFCGYSGFDSSVNPAIAQEFSTVAFRVGHTFLSGSLLLHDSVSPVGSISLMNAFFDPTLFHSNTIVLDEVLIGQTIQAANAADTKVIPEVRDFLFGHPVGGAGLDLVSLNIQRGRDNGVLKYNDMRTGLGLAPFNTFQEVTGGDAVIAAELAAAYSSVNECDPWICGLAEPAVGGGELGELFSVIIGDQFTRLMNGDRFFYLDDNDLKNGQIKQIVDIDSRTLTDVINDNTAGTISGVAMLVDKTAPAPLTC